MCRSMSRSGLLTLTLVFACMIALLHARASADLTEGLIAYWPCDEGQGMFVHDASGYGNDGMISGAAWVPGFQEWGLEILNTDIVGFIPPRFDDPIRDAFSVAAWVRWHGPSVYARPGAVFDGRSPVEGFFFGIQQDGCLRLNIYHPPSGGEGVSSTPPVPLDEWTHLAGVYDASSQTLRVYIAGAEAGVAAATYPYYDSYISAAMGNNRWAPGDGQWAPLNGILDEVRVYDRALSDEEIAELALGPTPTSETTWGAVKGLFR
jgi:hypothetical protein